MPPDDSSIEIQRISFNVLNTEVITAAITMGGRGQGVELLAAHYFSNNLPLAHGIFAFAMALSENPSHLGAPPTLAEFLTDPAVYALWYQATRAGLAGAAYGAAVDHSTQIIPLYGLIRPRRQIFMCANTSGQTILIRAEIYYRSSHLPLQDKVLTDRKHGLYHRT